MLKEYTRALNDNEKKSLQKLINLRKRTLSGAIKGPVIITAVIVGLGVTVNHFESGGNMSLADIGIMISIIFGGLFIFMYLINKKSLKGIQEIKDIIANNTINVLHCKSDKVIELEEVEDEGVAYIFQIEPNKMLYIISQELYEMKNFPNSDFEIAITPKDRPQLYEFYKHGQKLKLEFKIPGEKKKFLPPEIAYPDGDISILNGKIEDFKKYL